MKYFKSLSIILGLVLMAACAQQASQPTSNQVPLPQSLCPAGQTITNGGCVAISAPPYSVGPANFFMDNMDVHNYMGGDPRSTGTMRVNSNFSSFLKKAMQVCDRTSGLTGGYYSCSNWSSAYHQLSIQVSNATSNQATVTFKSIYISNGFDFNMNIGISSTFGAMKNPLMLAQQITPINNTQGFEMRSYGDTNTEAYKSLIQIQVQSGKLEDNYLDVKVLFEGQEIASGRMLRSTY